MGPMDQSHLAVVRSVASPVIMTPSSPVNVRRRTLGMASCHYRQPGAHSVFVCMFGRGLMVTHLLVADVDQ